MQKEIEIPRTTSHDDCLRQAAQQARIDWETGVGRNYKNLIHDCPDCRKAYDYQLQDLVEQSR